MTSDFHSFISSILNDHGLIDRDEYALRLADSLSKIERWDKEQIESAAREVPTNLHKLHREWTKTDTIELIASRIIRRWPKDPRQSVGTVKDVTNILFVVGDRGGSQRNQIQTPREFHAIDDAIRGSRNRERFNVLKPILAVNHEKLITAYRDRPTIIHFGGHGNDRSLSIILDQDLVVNATPLSAEQLATILGSFPDRLHLCVLNTCDSAPIAERLVLSDVVDSAIGWLGPLDDSVAIAFSRGLYGSLGDGLSLSRSVVLAKESSGTSESPQLYSAAGVEPTVFFFGERSSK